MALLEKQRGDVKDLALAEAGKNRIEWAATFMPVLAQIRERFAKTRPLAGVRIGACLHVTTETANLMLALKAGGAEIALCASNPLSTQDDVAAALAVHYEIPTFAIKGEDDENLLRAHRERSIASKPHMTMDDGCDLVTTIYTKHNHLLKDMIGGCEETTTGVIRLHAMEKDGVLPYPVDRRQRRADQAHVRQPLRHRPVDARRDHPRDERPARGHALVVVGYGWCGRGVASRAKGHGRARRSSPRSIRARRSRRRWTASR